MLLHYAVITSVTSKDLEWYFKVYSRVSVLGVMETVLANIGMGKIMCNHMLANT